MREIFAFTKDNAAQIVGTIVVLFLCATLFVPLFVAIGHYLWDLAINNPAALFD